MTEQSVVHDTFVIERIYAATPTRVFRAFCSEEAKSIWGDTGDIETGVADAGQSAVGVADAGKGEFDFRIGGRERFGFKYEGRAYRYDARYYDIVPDQRIIYSYEMYADGSRISVSVATIEFAQAADGTALTWTEQGAYLDGFDAPSASQLRQEGTAEMLDGLAKYLSSEQP